MVEPRNFRILIVEDQRPLRIVMTRLLQKMGHEVQAVAGGAEAIKFLDTYHPELIFSDISMPEMTGYELVRQLRQRDDLENTYFVAMTGLGQQSDHDQAIQSGFNEHMVKPIDINRLQELFGRLS
ncbi:response regulator [Allorhodopirellula heiligendammensis]|uniref:Chemotaxis protein CheY n=1 Tax=Allorhodopirellula heiligendammensis TaxID=2714739 RepID=A0A5C6C0I0_9BACT|nr:response regulator [Allorhodopirellula heiligendammensis]TWU16654.1 Chemotaxis protein CheY [Allorhodopirellula heiligendammensis]|tara:strand:- start:19 stop:393 length:375 start_codon:yes stop_codon:yes gene_type:complete